MQFTEYDSTSHKNHKIIIKIKFQSKGNKHYHQCINQLVKMITAA